jgi:hypothetical protein
VQPGALRDSLRIPLPGTLIAARAGGSRRLRVGFRVRSDSAVSLRVLSAQGGLGDFGPRLSFDPATDTLYRPVLVLPQSNTPAVTEVAAGLQDFQIVAHIGALGRRRGARRRRAAGAADVHPLRGGRPASPIRRRSCAPCSSSCSAPHAGSTRATRWWCARCRSSRPARVTDVRRAADLIAPGILPLDSLASRPATAGGARSRSSHWCGAWRGFPVASPRAIVLRAGLEGLQGGELRFFSVEAPVGLPTAPAPQLHPCLQLRAAMMPSRAMRTPYTFRRAPRGRAATRRGLSFTSAGLTVAVLASPAAGQGSLGMQASATRPGS